MERSHPPGHDPEDFMSLVDRLPERLLDRALTHASWVVDRTESYERLEFLGDSVLGLAVAAHLFERFPSYPEGRLAKIRAYAVSRESCALVAETLGVGELLLERGPGDPEQRHEIADNGTALGNVLEALIGAVYLEFGFAVARGAVVEAFRTQIRYGQSGYVDFKSTLQEHLAASQSDEVPRYRLAQEEGPPHRRQFTSEVRIDGRVAGVGTGRSIKSSEQEAAREALMDLGVIDRDGHWSDEP